MTTSLRRGGMMNRGGPSSGQLPPRQNVAVLVESYNIGNPRKGSNPDEDFVVGKLLHDVPLFGLTAGFVQPADENLPPEPTTDVKVMMPLPRGVELKQSKRRDIYGLSRPKGAGPAMEPGSIVVFEKAWIDRKDGVIKAHYAHGCASKSQLDEGLKAVYSDMLVCVRPEGTVRREGNLVPAGRVDVMIADTKMAEPIRDMADLEQKVGDLVARSGIGNPGFQLLARQVCPEDADPATFAANPNTRFGDFFISKRNRTGEGDDAVWTPETAAEMMMNSAEAAPRPGERVERRLEKMNTGSV